MTNERRLKRTNMPNVNNDYGRLTQFQTSGLHTVTKRWVWVRLCVCVWCECMWTQIDSRRSLSSSVFCLPNHKFTIYSNTARYIRRLESKLTKLDLIFSIPFGFLIDFREETIATIIVLGKLSSRHLSMPYTLNQ